jgi:benzoyl-CoA 2,3-dioxygenase component B
MFTDRDGKYQLAALAESGFDPLSRATRFMLTEEAFHLFVGETGIDRIVRRGAQLTKQDPNGDARRLGGIDLPLVQRFINFWFSSAVELFGGEISNNAADFFGAGLKGRYKERERHTDHGALEGHYAMDVLEGGKLSRREIPLRNAMNEVLRDEYVSDCERAVKKWNRTIAAEGLSFELSLPSRRFNRSMGMYAGAIFDPRGEPTTAEEFERRRAEWLPTAEDRAYLKSIMKPELEPGRFASWIAPPAKGVEGTALDFEYVQGEGVGAVRRGQG